MTRSRNGSNDPRADERRRAAYERGGTPPGGQPVIVNDEDPHREDDQLKCMCGLTRLQHRDLRHVFEADPIQNWFVSREYSEWIGSAGLER